MLKAWIEYGIWVRYLVDACLLMVGRQFEVLVNEEKERGGNTTYIDIFVKSYRPRSADLVSVRRGCRTRLIDDRPRVMSYGLSSDAGVCPSSVSTSS